MVNIQYTKIVIPEGVIANMVSQTVSPDRIIRGRQAFGGKDNLYGSPSRSLGTRDLLNDKFWGGNDNLYGGYRNFKLDRVLERR